MSIEFVGNKFHLYNNEISYVVEIGKDNDVLYAYYGSKIDAVDISVVEPISDNFQCAKMLDGKPYFIGLMAKEYPTAATPDFGTPAFEAEVETGKNTYEFKYVTHKIIDGKPPISGMPAVYVEQNNEAQTLVITTRDSLSGIEIDLYYTIFEAFNTVCRHSVIRNTSNTKIKIKNAQSMSMDLPEGEYEYIHLFGSWAREKHIRRHLVTAGLQGFESRVGSSGNNENPFMVFCEKGTDETRGRTYGISLVYSGNHKFSIESNSHNSVRIQAGINPFMFSFELDCGEEFTTPEAVMVYSDNGLGDMSRTFHKLYRTRLCRGKYRDSVRPILINNWEATYFNFNREKLLDIAERAADIGVELFVLDDGWFGKRNDDRTSLGDWVANEEKLGGSIASLAEEINKRGLKFGLWFEPEMISEESVLYKAHPDWVMGYPYGLELQGRFQHLLDLTKKEVRDYIVDSVSSVLKSANIEYVKWDKNRHLTTPFSDSLASNRQGELYHRYILGLYDIMDRVTSAFPEILFESCSGGGARNDTAMLYYMPQTWLSDDTDAIERLYIQSGASLVYPVSSFGTHVSAVPNHQTRRITSLSMRGTVAMNGAFGYELDLTKLSEDELNEMSRQIAFYKEEREIVMKGDYYRLLSPYTSRHSAWMYVTEDKQEALLYFAVATICPNHPHTRLVLNGLDADTRYIVNGKEYSGKTLMNYGIDLMINEMQTDNFIWKIKAKK